MPAFEYSVFPAASLASMTVETLLNLRASEGWRFVAFDGTNYIFERPESTATIPKRQGETGT